jgi:branched-chain amino acid transport system permease protein
MTNLFQYIVDALNLGSIYALVALGIGLLFGVLRLVNFAHGDFITVGAYALIVPSTEVTARLAIGNWYWALLVPAIISVVIVIALIADTLVYRRMRQAATPSLMIASFSVSYVIQNEIMLLYGSRPKAVGLWETLAEQMVIGTVRISLLQVTTIGTTISLMVLLLLFLKYTAIGLQMRASAEDFRMARYLGVNAVSVISVAFAISAVLAAVVALLYVSQTGVLTATMGVPLVLFGFIATVIGGMGSLQGSVIGGLLLGFIMTMLNAYLPDDLRAFREAFAFCLVIGILLFRPRGLFPSKTTTERI